MTRPRSFADIAFTPAVKKMQKDLGSRSAMEEFAKRQEGKGRDRITPPLAAYLGQCRSFYLASASKKGLPYVQHRGGQEGFIQILDERHFAFADFPGNKQYISLGNIAENPQVLLFVMNYAERQRIKIWGRAKIISREEDEKLFENLVPAGSTLYPSRAYRIEVEAWDSNCPQHIPILYPAEQVEAAIGKLEARILELEQRLKKGNTDS